MLETKTINSQCADKLSVTLGALLDAEQAPVGRDLHLGMVWLWLYNIAAESLT